jgi:hypothetical protein
MINNLNLKTDNITIQRYNSTIFGRMKPHKHGKYVRYCDSTQYNQTFYSLYSKAKERIEVVREQLELTRKDNRLYKEKLISFETSTAEVVKVLQKRITSIVAIAYGTIIGGFATFLGILAYYN